MRKKATTRMPAILESLRWSLLPGAEGAGTSRARLAWRTLRASLWHRKALRRWLAVVVDLHARQIVREVPGEYLRAIRPSVRGATGFGERVVQLIDHAQWLHTAFQPEAFAQLTSGEPVLLAEVNLPRGYDFMRLRLEQAPAQSPEGEMLLTLSLRRSADAQQKPLPVDVGLLCFSRFRVDGVPCLVMGGVRGQRNGVQRINATELNQVLQGWKPAVLLVMVAQELARYWGLRLIGLDPAAHRLRHWSYRWSKRYRAAARRIFESYQALWSHFEARPGPSGWLIIPLDSEENPAATALSPEQRARQIRRADYWIRTRNLLRARFRQLLEHPQREPSLKRVTQTEARDSVTEPCPTDFIESDRALPQGVLHTAPGTLD